MKQLQIVFGLILVVTFMSCEPDEVAPDPSESGSMTCTLNDAPWESVSFNNTLLHITDSEPTGKRLDLRGKALGIQLILTCGTTTSSAGTSMPDEVYTTGGTYEALVTIMEGLSIKAMATGVAGDPGTITITEIDGMTKTCSGTFSFSARNLDTDEIIYEAVDGVFTDLMYVVM